MSTQVWRKIKEWYLNRYTFSNYDNTKFILLLSKGLYLYEYMDDLEKVNETSLPDKEDFYSHLNMEDIIDTNYAHAKRVCKNFRRKRFKRKSWFVCPKWYIIISWCISELSKYLS